ncbi:MAG: SH3 domain-containing protein [Deltaproteobacteria bacterium]|nr:SH3 domain-containing protein [Deltaproteobacteria bacterium]
MRKKALMGTLFTFFGLLICLHEAMAFSVYVGKVVGLSSRELHVQRADGHIALFRVGWRTKYYPNRKPFLGERVKVEYLYDRGENVAYTLVILSSPPPPPPRSEPPPPPARERVTPFVVGPETALSGEVVVVRSANVRTGPANTYRIIAVAHKGRNLKLKGQSKGWYLVYLPERNMVGWIYSGLVRVVMIKSPGR